MSLSINTNVISLSVQRHFNTTTNRMNDAMEKMTTGFKINSAADDAAGYGVVKKMESVLSTYDVAETNGQMGSSLLQTQEGVLELVTKSLLPSICIMGPEAIAVYSPMTNDMNEVRNKLLSFIPDPPEIWACD